MALTVGIQDLICVVHNPLLIWFAFESMTVFFFIYIVSHVSVHLPTEPVFEIMVCSGIYEKICKYPLVVLY